MKLGALLVIVLGATAVPVAHADDGPLFRLVDTAAQRLLTADAVAAVKWIDGGAIEDPVRVGHVLDAVAAQAENVGINPTFVRRVFADQIRATEGVEYARFGQWKLDPAAAPTTAPELAQSRTAIDVFNRTMVTELAAHRDLLRTPECGSVLDATRTQVSTARQLDPLYHQALAAATRDYCDAIT